MQRSVVAVDVGTTSARAAVVDPSGRLLARAERAFTVARPQPDWAEHRSTEVWAAVGEAVRNAVAASGVAPDEVAGISFDATCSLVVRATDGSPVSVSGADDAFDTIVWLDHRALAEAEACTATGHRVLDYIGGVMSPEMETPKLMWLKRHRPETWARAGLFLDLADFLTWKASGSTARSECTLTCKWTYLGHEAPGWQHDFFAEVGLGDMLERGDLPALASPIGKDVGPLTAAAAAELGLTERCRVGIGLIDAHAGALGVLGSVAAEGPASLDRRLALIAGTSSCHMALSQQPRAVRGVWGPYRGAVLPGLWLNEGGQSATGALLDHVLQLHGAGGKPESALHGRVVARIAELRRTEGASFAERLHVLPDFHGNRSPWRTRTQSG